MFSAAHPSTELMKLGKSEAFCVFDHHNRGVGHVNAYLDYSGGHQDLDLVSCELLHDLIFLGLLHFSVQTAHNNAAAHLFLKHGRIVQYIFYFQMFAFLDHGTDNVALPPLADLLFHKMVCRSPVAGVYHTVFDGQPVCRQFIDHGNIQIAI